MPKIVGIRFKPITKVYYFDPGQMEDLEKADWVIVETARGREMGQVNLPMKEVPPEEIKGELKTVVRRANSIDLMLAQEYKSKEDEALGICKQLVERLSVPMKVVQASYSFDGSRLLFSFTADQRVDFRDLVKELAKSLKTRIEMKQIGARDETKLIDGYGRCGRQLCCSSWLTEFHPVSIRMAKQQGLPLAPTEISGVCGRLLCCLAYEDTMYAEIKKSLPKVGSRVETPDGPGVIRGLNVIQEKVIVEIEGKDNFVEMLATDIGSGPRAKPEPDDIVPPKEAQEPSSEETQKRHRGKSRRRRGNRR